MTACAWAVCVPGLLALLLLPDLGWLSGQAPFTSVAWAAEPRAQGQDLGRIARLNGEPQRRALQALLADVPDEHQFLELVLYYEDRIRPPLRTLLADPRVGERAKYFLALIGIPEDLQLIVRLAPPPSHQPRGNRWAYGVACALLDPGSEEEWAFLRSAALNEYHDRWVDAGAIQTLKLIASPRSRQILEEVKNNNTVRARSIAKALEYIQSSPPPLLDQRLEELSGRVAQATIIGNWEGDGQPRYSRTRDKALVDFVFRTREDRLIYSATFHRVLGIWKLRGVRETLQEFAPPSVVMPAPPPVLLPPPPILSPDPTLSPVLPLLLPGQVSPPPAPK